MRSFILATVVAMGASVGGCNRTPPEKVQPAPGIEVNAPGVHIEAGNGKGLEVNAPGVEIKTQPEK